MSSLFDLKQSASELPSLNQGMAKLTYEQYTPQRSIVGTQFSNGEIHIKFSMSGSRWWIPGRSYIRMRARYGTGPLAVTDITRGDDIGPNMGTMANLFQNCEFRMAGKTISRISANMAQIDALENRLLKSKAWLDGAGASLNNWEPDPEVRKLKISDDGYYGNQAVEQWNPPTQFLTVTNTVQLVRATGQVLLEDGAGDPGNLPNPLTDVLLPGDLFIYKGISYTVRSVVNANGDASNFFVYPNPAADQAAEAAGTNAFIRRKITAQRSNIEMIWQPPLSIFKIGHALPAGDYELLLNPHPGSTFELLSVESTTLSRTVGDNADGTQFHFSPVDLYLYVATIEGPAVSNLTYFMSLEETRCQRRNVTGDGASLTQEPFEVSPSTYALSCAFQSQAAGSNTLRSSSKFKIQGSANFPDTSYSLNRMFIQYAGMSKPSPDADPSYTSPADYLTSRYAETQLYSMNYFSEPGPEDKRDWLSRGPYYYFAWPRDGTSEATHVTVNFQFSEALVAASANVLLFDHHKKMILVSISGGKVIDVVEQSG